MPLKLLLLLDVVARLLLMLLELPREELELRSRVPALVPRLLLDPRSRVPALVPPLPLRKSLVPVEGREPAPLPVELPLRPR